MVFETLSAMIGAAESGDAPPAPPGSSSLAVGNPVDEEGEAEIKAHPFFHYYSRYSQQQNMLLDLTRTSTYQRAILENPSNFKGKVVLDVGTGSGILAIFAAQAGAKKVYAVEASDIARGAEKIIQANNLGSVIQVIKGKIERIELPEKVDIIISEPMGFLLVHERMLESYVEGRKRFMREDIEPKMFPSRGTMYFLPFSDFNLYGEQFAKAQFWSQTEYFGVDLSAVKQEALQEHFSQPVVGAFDPSCLISDQSKPVSHVLDFETISVEDMQDFTVNFNFVINTTTLLHGIAGWFDVDFIGNHRSIKLSTDPWSTTTHWYQCRLLLPHPLAVNEGQSVSGSLHFQANDRFSHNIKMTVHLDATKYVSEAFIRLQDQFYHYLQGAGALQLSNAD